MYIYIFSWLSCLYCLQDSLRSFFFSPPIFLYSCSPPFFSPPSPPPSTPHPLSHLFLFFFFPNSLCFFFFLEANLWTVRSARIHFFFLNLQSTAFSLKTRTHKTLSASLPHNCSYLKVQKKKVQISVSSVFFFSVWLQGILSKPVTRPTKFYFYIYIYIYILVSSESLSNRFLSHFFFFSLVLVLSLNNNDCKATSSGRVVIPPAPPADHPSETTIF